MSNENYTNCSNQELVDLVFKLNNGKHTNRLKFLIKRDNPNLFDEILKRTNFVPEQTSFMARLYCLKHNIDSIPLCPTCHQRPIRLDSSGLYDHCSRRCSTLDKNVQKKLQDTCLRKYNVSHAQKSKEIQDKIKRTKLERYGDENYNNKEKAKSTNMQKYGVEEVLSSPEIRTKIQETMLYRYGVENYVITNEFKQKAKETMLNSIGVEHALQNPDILKKMQETTLSRFGVTCSLRNPEVNKKTVESLVSHYGVTCTWNSDLIREKAKDTLLQRYDVDSPFKSFMIRELSKQTMLNRYGVEYYAQSYEYHKRKRHKYHSEKYPELTFDSTWEVKVYEFCRDNKINVEYSPKISYDYEYCEKTYTYHPDFLINGKVYEVKGDYFFRINPKTGKEEMYCPYCYDDWSDEYYGWLCEKYEAKHQCMLKNNVIILRESDIKNLNGIAF